MGLSLLYFFANCGLVNAVVEDFVDVISCCAFLQKKLAVRLALIIICE